MSAGVVPLDQGIEHSGGRIETTRPTERLVVGFSSFGLAGLIAVNFLMDQRELTETGPSKEAFIVV